MSRKPDPINVFIVEHHNEVLNILYRGIGSKKIPYSNLKLLHYDAHPDLGVSNSDWNTLKYNPPKLLNETSIENWILPAVYCGHIDHVIWMRPYYCNQLGDRISQEYNIGYDSEGTKMLVDINDLYFISEGSFARTENLQNKVKFKLSVGPIHYTHTMCKFCYDINIQLMNSTFILDIDLDTFAPINPFLNKYNSTQTYFITNLYGLPKTDAAVNSQKELNNQPYPFRLKHVRYPAKKYDGQISYSPKGSLPFEIADEISSNRCQQLDTLKNHINELQFGIVSCNYEVLKLLGLFISITGFNKFYNCMMSHEQKILKRLKENDQFTNKERDLLRLRGSLKSIPPSFMRQIEEIFNNERSKNVFYILHELESIFIQLKTQSSGSFFINWLKLPKYLKRKLDFNVDTDDESEDLLMFYHYLFSSCGFEWNGQYDSLPHKPNPSDAYFQDALNDLASLLNRLHSPIMITISRSCDDGYIRKEIIDKVESSVLRCLERVYENRNLNIIRYDPENSHFTWPSTKHNRNSTKLFNEVTVSFRNTTDKLDKKDIL